MPKNSAKPKGKGKKGKKSTRKRSTTGKHYLRNLGFLPATGDGCAISFTIGIPDGGPEVIRRAQIDRKDYITFSGDTATAVITKGEHSLEWYAEGVPGTRWNIKLAGDVDGAHEAKGKFPGSGRTGGEFDFVAKEAS